MRAGDGTAVKTWSPRRGPNTGADRLLGRPDRVARRRQAGPLLVPPDRRAAGGASVRSAQAADSERDAFDLYDNMFPIRGRHDFGGAERASAGPRRPQPPGPGRVRGCGTPLVAARGGRVKFKQYHAAAGNYLVIDAAGTGVDYVYMHLAEPAPVPARRPRLHRASASAPWATTGNARGCHLHFELWGGPGWYDGGQPFDPLPSLQAWDGWSVPRARALAGPVRGRYGSETTASRAGRGVKLPKPVFRGARAFRSGTKPPHHRGYTPRRSVGCPRAPTPRFRTRARISRNSPARVRARGGKPRGDQRRLHSTAALDVSARRPGALPGRRCATAGA